LKIIRQKRKFDKNHGLLSQNQVNSIKTIVEEEKKKQKSAGKNIRFEATEKIKLKTLEKNK